MGPQSGDRERLLRNARWAHSRLLESRAQLRQGRDDVARSRHRMTGLATLRALAIAAAAEAAVTPAEIAETLELPEHKVQAILNRELDEQT